MSKTGTERDIDRLLDELAVDQHTVDDPADLRRIGLAKHGLQRAESELRDAVHAARANGRSWGYIGLVLGVSKQAAQQRFGNPPAPTKG